MRGLSLLVGAIAGAVILGFAGLAGATDASGPMSLSLDQCVEMAIEVNVSVLKAGYALDQSRYGVLSTASGLVPSAAWSATRNRWQTPTERIVNDQLILTSRSYSTAFSVYENVSAGNVISVFQQIANKNAARQDLRLARQQVAFISKQKYFEVLKDQKLLQVAEETLAQGKMHLDKAQAMLDVGTGVKSDVLQAQVQASNNELALISARNALRLAETDLKHFLAIPDEREVQLEDVLEGAQNTITLDAAIAEALVQRPDVRAYGELVKASRRGVWARRGGWIPVFSFAWSKLYTAPADHPELPDNLVDLWDKAEWSWRLSWSVNIFDGLQTFSQVKIAKGALESAREDLIQSRRDASLEVRQAYYNVEQAEQSVKVSTETVGLAEEELRLAEERYRLGGGTMLEQIDAQLSLTQAKTTHIQALYGLLLSRADLMLAIGQD